MAVLLVRVGVELCLCGLGVNPGVGDNQGRPRHRWDGNIKIDLEEIGWCVDFD
jgi:hypothetical protein